MEESFLELFGDLYEDHKTEFKAAQGKDGSGKFPIKALESYSAFANTEGGRIILGMNDKGKVLGIKNTQKVQNEIWNALNDSRIVSENVLAEQDVQVVKDPDGKKIIVITVGVAHRKQRPVFVRGTPMTGTYLRKFEGDYVAPYDLVKRMFADQSDEPSDARIINHLTLADLDDETISQYRNLFKSTSPDHPFLTGSNEELLRNIGAMKFNHETSKYELTAAGLLVFGDEVLICEIFPSFGLDYQEKSSENPRWVDRVSTDGTWKGNLFQFYRKVLPRLTGQLKIPFFLDPKQQRIDTTQIHKALREAFVNTLIHSDYRGTTPILITKRDDHFEFRNPGRLRITSEQFFRGSTSDCRNPSIQKIFRMIGAGEKAGAGGLLIGQTWRNRHWKKPKVIEDFERDVTTLILSFENLWGPEVLEKLRRRFPDFLTLNPDERAILAIAVIDGNISHRLLQGHLQLHRRDLTLMLSKLVRDGYLVNNTVNRRSSYHLGFGSPQLSLFGEKAPFNSDNKSSNSDNKSSNSNNKSSNSDNKSSNSDNKSSNSDNKSSNSDNKDPSSDNDELQLIARPITETRRAKRHDIENAILQLCKVRPLSLTELSALLERSRSSVSQYVRPLLKDEKLRLRYPQRPNHPKQAYIFDN